MATQIKRRRGTTSQHSSFTGAEAELTVDSDKNTVVVHDEETAGGHPLAKEDWLSVEPHIIPGVLYPAVAGKLLDGTTSHGATYGVAQADGKKYYYTDIKGSKPIKDPRIGAHFGSQRHKFKSRQLLEQETATHGDEVYSVDGREWIRLVGSSWVEYNTTWGKGWYASNGATTNSNFCEIVGYFSDANISGYGGTTRDISITTDGGTPATNTGLTSTIDNPLSGRYVDAASLVNLGLDKTLGIHTLKIGNVNGDYCGVLYNIELITQDTTSTATKSKIQIPSQNVVSYGKKFTVSGTPHYNPFAYAGDGTTAVAIGDTTSHGKVADGWAGATATYFDSTLDTATSLGLSAWETGGDFYRPVNGGRVVKWVDSSGNIKTSVNMMPPTGTAIGAASDAALPTSHAWTTVYQPKLSSTTIDHSQAEVAKTFHAREFGNGSANGNASYADASTLNTIDAISYVMDDGLTSSSATNAAQYSTYNGGIGANDGSYVHYYTFIGTGISVRSASSSGITWNTYAQNLPYGTHILKLANASSDGIVLDGVTLQASGTSGLVHTQSELTFHQPKRPPIPEDAVVIADYMLMADFVSQPTTLVDASVSKGVRAVSGSRDVFCDDTGDRAFYSDATDSVFLGTNFYMGMATFYSHASTDTSSAQLPFFGTNALIHLQGSNADHIVDFGGSTDVATTALDYGASSVKDIISIDSSATLGINTVKATIKSSGYSFQGFDVVTPIHTSSHYQSFETPYLHELVGGDRNMEQNNLIVTPDGKTWDEVTRDTSYIGNTVVKFKRDGGHVNNAWYIWDVIRGDGDGAESAAIQDNMVQKNVALAYDRIIFLESGEYDVSGFVYNNAADAGFYVMKNTTTSSTTTNLIYLRMDSADSTNWWHATVQAKRGDYLLFLVPDIAVNAINGNNATLNDLTIKKL